MKHDAPHAIAFGGMAAALAVVIMCLVGMIPVATYLCPMLCIVLLDIVFMRCGNRIAWAWYGTVALLSLLLGPDKEAAGIFLVLGYYPIVKPRLDRLPLKWLWKLLLFNGAVAVLYLFLIHLLGIAEVAEESGALGAWSLAITLVLGDLTFFFLDLLLSRMKKRR